MMMVYMKDPAQLKALFKNECQTGTVTEDPLLSIYAYMDHDDYSSSPHTSIVVCRPKRGEDDTFAKYGPHFTLSLQHTLVELPARSIP
jgi:hypothetical protein